VKVRRFSITLHGRVQGVGFRFFTIDCARRHALSGWVRNSSDGGVTMEVQGDENDLEAFRIAIKEGPVPARVLDMKVVELPLLDNEKSFEVRY
jgi:acylphosphatase